MWAREVLHENMFLSINTGDELEYRFSGLCQVKGLNSRYPILMVFPSTYFGIIEAHIE